MLGTQHLGGGERLRLRFLASQHAALGLFLAMGRAVFLCPGGATPTAVGTRGPREGGPRYAKKLTSLFYVFFSPLI